jgi:hypothetical protein
LPVSKFPEYPYIINKKEEQWENYLKEDFDLWEEIEKDTSRTHAELAFFSTPASEIMIPFLTAPRKEKFKVIYGENEAIYKQFMGDKALQRKTYRYDYLSRILYIYAKLNKRIKYVQGMNEILAPIFYLVNIGKPPGAALEEVSVFYMFNNAITDVISLHIKDLDQTENGIYGKINQVNEMLLVIAPGVWYRLDLLKIDSFYYCFRWITLFFAQEFHLFDTLRIWESLFACSDRMLFMSFFAISILISF